MISNKKFNGQLIKVLLFNAILFVLLVILADIFLWLFLPVAYLDQTKVKLRYQDIPGIKHLIKYESGIYGLRMTSDFDVNKPNNLIRVLCLGASTTQQATQETKDTWCGIVEKELRKHFKNSTFQIQTLAFGKGGFKAKDNAQWLVNYFDKIKPDIVITLLGINDLVWNGGANYKYSGFIEPVLKKHGAEQYSQIFRRIKLYKINKKIKKNLETGNVIAWTSKALPDLRKSYQKLPYTEKLERNPDPIGEFHDYVKWILEFLRKREVQTIVLGQPVLWKEKYDPDEFDRLWFSVSTPNGAVRTSGKWMKEEMARYNAVQELLAEQAQFVYIDMDARIPKTVEYYFDDCHFTDIGSNAVATNILPSLITTIENTYRVISYSKQ
jgi:hypothetical protein